MTARARQTEARTLLTNIYSCEVMFHSDWNIYFADWRDIGFFPEGTLNYILGFSVPYDPIPAGINYTGPSYSGPQPNPVITAAVVNNNNGYCGTSLLPDCVTTQFARNGGGSPVWGVTMVSNSVPNKFVAAAAGQITSDPNLIDGWLMDSNKTITNAVQGY